MKKLLSIVAGCLLISCQSGIINKENIVPVIHKVQIEEHLIKCLDHSAELDSCMKIEQRYFEKELAEFSEGIRPITNENNPRKSRERFENIAEEHAKKLHIIYQNCYECVMSYLNSLNIYKEALNYPGNTEPALDKLVEIYKIDYDGLECLDCDSSLLRSLSISIIGGIINEYAPIPKIKNVTQKGNSIFVELDGDSSNYILKVHETPDEYMYKVVK